MHESLCAMLTLPNSSENLAFVEVVTKFREVGEADRRDEAKQVGRACAFSPHGHTDSTLRR